MMSPRISQIAQRLCLEHKADFADFQAGRQYAPCVQVRRELATMLRSEGMSFPLIGRALNLHHTSVMNLVRNYDYAAARVIPVPDLSGEWAI